MVALPAWAACLFNIFKEEFNPRKRPSMQATGRAAIAWPLENRGVNCMVAAWSELVQGTKPNNAGGPEMQVVIEGEAFK